MKRKFRNKFRKAVVKGTVFGANLGIWYGIGWVDLGFYFVGSCLMALCIGYLGLFIYANRDWLCGGYTYEED